MRLLVTISVLTLATANAKAYNYQDLPLGRDDVHQRTRRADNNPAPPVQAARPSGVPDTPQYAPVLMPADCGAKNATADITPISGPNGNEDFLNCGLTYGGWTPPMLHVSELVTVSLSADGHFAPCASLVDLFTRYAQPFGLSPILLAAFAMERSNCDASKVGPNGEQGVMQLTTAQCVGSPGISCQDPTYNIQTFAQAFVNTLNSNGGNVVQTVGEFAKWYVGLTAGEATCASEIDLDFLQRFFNGWLQDFNGWPQNTDPETPTLLGKYFNLASCLQPA